MYNRVNNYFGGITMKDKTNIIPAEENVIAGTVGALLFSLVGGILWYVLYQVGYLAAISGIVGVICAVKGYSFFGKKESIKGIVISVIAAVIVIVIAWYLCLANDVYSAYQAWYENGEIDYTVTFADAVRGAHYYLEEPDIAAGYFKDLAIGLLLCVVGSVSYIITAVKRVKAEKQAELIISEEPSLAEAEAAEEAAVTEE